MIHLILFNFNCCFFFTESFLGVKNPSKPFGTDDGFDGEGAACGTSIVKVARQMVSGKSLARGYTVAK